jgi:thiamine biosynthesis protein ThiI
MTTQSAFLIRFSGDLSTKKGRAFARFRSRLAHNLRDSLRAAGLDFDLKLARHRFFLQAPPEAEGVLAHVFGVQSWSPVASEPWQSFDDLVDLGARHFAEAVRGRTFAVRVRRSRIRGSVDFTSLDVERELGTRLLDESAGVNLGNPEITARVELDHGVAHLFSEVRRGPAGLPIGSEGRALTLISGGIDSAVAAWLMLKRGVEVDYIFFNLGGTDHENQVLEVMRVLADGWSYGYRPRLRLVDLRPFVEQLRERTAESLWQVVLKRLMLRAASASAADTDTQALVTGEAIGQVSSQTLHNLAVLEAASELPVLRPLLTFDKSEIVELAQHIGTYDLSAHVPEYCALQGRAPATEATEKQLAAAEQTLDLEALLEQVASSPNLDLRTLVRGQQRAGESLAISEVPEGAVVVDLRSRAAFEAWHLPGAVRLDYLEAIKAAAHFADEPDYVVCCEVEFKSADIAERLRAAGRRAWFFEGGTSKLLKWADSRDLVLAQSVSPATRDAD